MIHSLNAVSPLLCRLIPKLFFPLDQPQQDAATVKGVGYSEQFLCEIVAPSNDCNGSYTFLQHANINSLPGPFNVCFPYPLSGNSHGCYHRNVDTAVSRVVCLLSQSLLTSASKYLTVSVFSFLCFKLCMDPYTVTVSGLNSSVKVSSIWDSVVGDHHFVVGKTDKLLIRYVTKVLTDILHSSNTEDFSLPWDFVSTVYSLQERLRFSQVGSFV